MYLARVCSRHEEVLEKEFQVLASADHELSLYRPEEERTSDPGALYNLHQDRTRTHEQGADEATGPKDRHKAPARGPDWTPNAECPNALLGQVLLTTDRPHESWLWKVSQDVGFEKLPDGWVGVRVLAASEDVGDGAESWLKQLRFELLVLDGSNLGHLEATQARPLPRGTPTSLKGYQRSVAPGPYLLRVHHPRGILEIPLVVQKDRRCDMAIYRDAEGHLVLSRYSPRSTGPPRSVEEVRKLSLLQCDLAANEMVAIPDLIESLHGPTMDPIAAVIEAYLSLSSSEDDSKLAAEAEQLVKRYPELPDFSVFKAIVHESDDLAMGVVGTTPRAAAEAYAEALGKGLPIFEGFHKAMGNAVRRDPKVGRNAKFFAKFKEHAAQTVPDQLWTAWWPTGR